MKIAGINCHVLQPLNSFRITQGLESVAEHLWRHRDKCAAQLDDRLVLRKLLQDDEESLKLVVAIRYVRSFSSLGISHMQADNLQAVDASLLCSMSHLWHLFT